jgi:hypothetical protein
MTDCPERVRLSQELYLAVQAVYDATAIDRKRLDYASTLSQARNSERREVTALDEHRRRHGC